MKIAFFSDSYKPYLSGVVKSIELFKNEMEELGHEVYIFAPDYPEVVRQEHIYRFKSIPAPTNSDFRLALPISTKLTMKLRELQPDLIHTHSPFMMGLLARIEARKLDIPLVFTYHTLYDKYAHYAPLGKELARKLAVKYTRDFCKSCDLVVAPSEYVKKRLNSYKTGVPVISIPTGIDLSPYLLHKNKKEDIRKKYCIEPEERMLLFVGRLGLEKNLYFLLKVMKRVTDSLPGSKLILVGDGPERDSLREFAGKLSIAEQVIFAGRQESDRVVEHYLAADLFVFPSLTETQGLVILEAMAGGLPVLAVDAAGPSSMVEDGVDGFLIEDDDIEDFASRVIYLLSSEKRYRLLKENALKKAKEFSIGNMTLNLLDAYSELIKDRALRKIVSR